MLSQISYLATFFKSLARLTISFFNLTIQKLSDPRIKRQRHVVLIFFNLLSTRVSEVPFHKLSDAHIYRCQHSNIEALVWENKQAHRLSAKHMFQFGITESPFSSTCKSDRYRYHTLKSSLLTKGHLTAVKRQAFTWSTSAILIFIYPNICTPLKFLLLFSH